MPAQPVDLSNCDREPIHIPGSIQPHGCLLACDMEISHVLRHSANSADMLGLASDLNGRTVLELLGADVTHDLRNAVSAAPEANRAAVIAHMQLPAGGYFDIAVHRQNDVAILEFEPSHRRTQPCSSPGR